MPAFARGDAWAGNKGGKPGGERAQVKFAERIKAATNGGRDLITTAVAIMNDTANTAGERLAAVKWLADRCFGTAPQTIVAHVSVGPRVDLSRLSDSELEQYVTLATKALPPAEEPAP